VGAKAFGSGEKPGLAIWEFKSSYKWESRLNGRGEDWVLRFVCHEAKRNTLRPRKSRGTRRDRRCVKGSDSDASLVVRR